ncbi:MAG: glycosyl transferase [bacterium]|nr:MAG: glycosyl transferase [bacterium]
MRLSVVIVNFNTGDCLKRCLDSITARFSGIDYEVVVIDNASDDGSEEAADGHPRTALIRNDRNAGFASACNAGAGKAAGDVILFLNPDTRILSDGIAVLLESFDGNERAGALGCRNRLPGGGGIQTSVYRFPTFLQVTAYVFRLRNLFMIGPVKRVLSPFLMWRFGQFHPHDRAMTVDYVTGAFLLVKRAAWRRLGGFDEKFFLFCEEIDLCRRLKKLGGEVMFDPSFEIEHHVGYSSQNTKPRVTLEKFKSYLVYFNKHHGRLKVSAIKIIFYIGIRFWMILYKLTGNRDAYKTYKMLKRKLQL